MQISTNLSSLNVRRAAARNGIDLERTAQRLASGLRVNSAKDDAAALAAGERMTTQIRGTRQAIRNANEGSSILQVADGAMNSIVTALQRVRELAVQANNASLTRSDKLALQQEASQHLDSINLIAASTVFNGEQVFSQDADSLGGDANRRAVIDGLKLGWLEESEKRIKDKYGLVATNGAAFSVDFNTTDGAGGVLAFVSYAGTNVRLAVDIADFTPPNLPNGGSAPFYNDRIIAHEMVHGVMSQTINMGAMPTWFLEGTAEFIHGADERLSGDIAANGTANVVNRINAAWGSASIDYSSAYAAARYMHSKLASAGGIKAVTSYLQQNPASNLDTALNSVSNGMWASAAAFRADFTANGVNFITNSMNLTNTDTGAIGGLDADNGSVLTAENVFQDIGTKYGDDVLEGFKETYQAVGSGATGTKTMRIQVGADGKGDIQVLMPSLNAFSLGISDTDLTTAPSAAMVHVDQALDYINKHRSAMGAAMNRIEASVSYLDNAKGIATVNRSRLLDADYAVETAKWTRGQILQQSANRLLTQTNRLPQMVLSLLR